jgi:hypothetical protein
LDHDTLVNQFEFYVKHLNIDETGGAASTISHEEIFIESTPGVKKLTSTSTGLFVYWKEDSGISFIDFVKEMEYKPVVLADDLKIKAHDDDLSGFSDRKSEGASGDESEDEELKKTEDTLSDLVPGKRKRNDMNYADEASNDDGVEEDVDVAGESIGTTVGKSVGKIVKKRKVKEIDGIEVIRRSGVEIRNRNQLDLAKRFPRIEKGAFDSMQVFLDSLSDEENDGWVV